MDLYALKRLLVVTIIQSRQRIISSRRNRKRGRRSGLLSRNWLPGLYCSLVMVDKVTPYVCSNYMYTNCISKVQVCVRAPTDQWHVDPACCVTSRPRNMLRETVMQNECDSHNGTSYKNRFFFCENNTATVHRMEWNAFCRINHGPHTTKRMCMYVQYMYFELHFLHCSNNARRLNNIL